MKAKCVSLFVKCWASKKGDAGGHLKLKIASGLGHFCGHVWLCLLDVQADSWIFDVGWFVHPGATLINDYAQVQVFCMDTVVWDNWRQGFCERNVKELQMVREQSASMPGALTRMPYNFNLEWPVRRVTKPVKRHLRPTSYNIFLNQHETKIRWCFSKFLCVQFLHEWKNAEKGFFTANLLLTFKKNAWSRTNILQ